MRHARGAVACAFIAAGPLALHAQGFEGVSAALPTGSAAISADALAAAYDMTSLTSDGLLRDFGPHGLHGSFEGARNEPGPVSGARVFRLVEDRVDLPEAAALDLDGPLTIAAWVRVDSLGLHQHIAACDDKWSLWITPADQYRLGIRLSGWSSDEGAVVAGAWAAVVVVLRGTRGDALDRASISLWVDGRLVDGAAVLRSNEAEAAVFWNPGELFATDACHLGFESHQGLESHKTLPFFGAIDELLVFGRAWSEAEVLAFSRVGG